MSQIEILELKNTSNKMKKKNTIENFNSRWDQSGERTGELKDKAFEIIHSEENKEKEEWKRVNKPCRTHGPPLSEQIYTL